LTDIQPGVSRAMIAEDDDDDFEIFSAAIDEVSIAVVLSRAENGEVLMKKLNSIDELPEILFLDLLMPCTDGQQCLKMIRSNKRFDALPIIMVSSVTDPKSIEFCFREGSNLFLPKPTSIKELTQALEKIFSIDWTKLYYPPITQFILQTKPPHEI
jgi:CheY-like chemotaxis protein